MYRQSLRYRMCIMRDSASRRGKIVPTYKELGKMFRELVDMKCPHCSVTMSLHGSRYDRPTRVSLQHNNNGRIWLLCYTCNNGHGHSKLGDAWFDISKGYKYCPQCKQILHKETFRQFSM